MRREYTKTTTQVFDEEMQPIGEMEEVTMVSLIADSGKIFRCKSTGFLGGTRIDLAYREDIENYEEIENPTYAEVVNEIIQEVKDE